MRKAVVLIGPNGGGKGTQIEYLREHGFTEVCMSKILEEKAQNDQVFAEMTVLTKQSGQLVPFEMTMGALDEHLHTILEGTDLAIDGVPRDRQQAQWLLNWLAYREYKVVFINIDNLTAEQCEQRMQQRVIQMRERGEMPRQDDENPEARKRRLAKYFANLGGILNYLEDAHQRVVKVDGTMEPQKIAEFIGTNLPA